MHTFFYNLGNIECVAFPIFQKKLQYESERETRMAHRRAAYIQGLRMNLEAQSLTFDLLGADFRYLRSARDPAASM